MKRKQMRLTMNQQVTVSGSRFKNKASGILDEMWFNAKESMFYLVARVLSIGLAFYPFMIEKYGAGTLLVGLVAGLFLIRNSRIQQMIFMGIFLVCDHLGVTNFVVKSIKLAYTYGTSIYAQFLA